MRSARELVCDYDLFLVRVPKAGEQPPPSLRDVRNDVLALLDAGGPSVIDVAVRVFREAGYLPGDERGLRVALLHALVRTEAGKRFADPADIDDFRDGWLFSRDSMGHEVRGQRGETEAWLAGREANPEAAQHDAAKARADSVVTQKFGQNPCDPKAKSVWEREYAKAFRGQA